MRRFYSWLQRTTLFPFSDGLLGILVSVAFWFALFLLTGFVGGAGAHLIAVAQTESVGQHLATLAQVTGIDRLLAMLVDATGLDVAQVGLILLAAILAIVVTAQMAFIGWLLITTDAVAKVIWRALNGHPPSGRADVKAALNAGALLTLWLVLFGMAAWIFTVWEALLACGIVAALWRLRYPAKREFFGSEACGELSAAWQAGKSLAVVLFLVIGIMLTGHAAILALPTQWTLTLIALSAALILWFVLLVEGRIRKAISIALHERVIYRIRKRDT